MKLSEFWLREFIDLEINSNTLIEQMIMLGLEINNIKSVAGKFHNIVIGEIIEYISYHENDKYILVKANIGEKKILSIVSDNSILNYTPGTKVAIAKIGSILFKNKEVKLKNIQGHYSEGIICSYFDLGIFNNKFNNKIVYFAKNAPIGVDVYEYLQLNDNILEVNLTPNRADCLSVLGIARDVAAYNKIKLHNVKIKPSIITDHTFFPIYIKEQKACPRYLGRIIKDININTTIPRWMAEKLSRSGINIINPIVDITNYILLELGQPLHAYDFDKINDFIFLRMAKKNEEIVILDDRKIILDEETLVVSDKSNILSIAGIYGGKFSSINKKTINIFLESAFFNPLFISGQSRKYNIFTKAAHLFERGVDPNLQYSAMERATNLIFDICGGKIGNIIDVTHVKELPQSSKITLTRTKLDLLIGHYISDDEIVKIFQGIGCKIFIKNKSWDIITPSWRFDLHIEEDLIEEVVRLYGYEKIPSLPFHFKFKINKKHKSNISLNRIKNLLVDRGYNEVISYSFVDPKIQVLLHPNEPVVTLTHPISINMSVMRLSLLTGLLTTLIYNQNRQQNSIKLFETGLCFIPDKLVKNGIRQDFVLAGMITGYHSKEHWIDEKRILDFFDIKGDLETILNLIGKSDNFFLKPKKNLALHTEQSAGIYINNIYIGYIGAIHPEITKQLDIDTQVFVFELQWKYISKYNLPIINQISRFPSYKRDVVIIIADNIVVENVLLECKKIITNNIASINLFDVYSGKGISSGYKSIGISFIFQSVNCTLKEKEISIFIDKCIIMLKNKFHASLRY